MSSLLSVGSFKEAVARVGAAELRPDDPIQAGPAGCAGLGAVGRCDSAWHSVARRQLCAAAWEPVASSEEAGKR